MKNKKLLAIGITLALLLVISLSVLSIHAQAGKNSDLPIIEQIFNEITYIDNGSIEFNFINVTDCPSNIEGRQVSRTVLQIIDNTFHKWYEYDIGFNGEFCIVLEKPYKKALTEIEARELLSQSQTWVEESATIPQNMEILQPDDPRVNLPYIETDINNNSIISDSDISLSTPTSVSKILTSKSSDIRGEKQDELLYLEKIQLNEIVTTIESEEISLITEAIISANEIEPNNSITEANLIHANYYGDDDYQIQGTITYDINDIDYYVIQTSVSGTFNLEAYWITGDPSVNEWHEDLFLVVQNSSGTTLAVAQLENEGTSEEIKQLTIDLKNGIYVFAILANDNYSERYTGEGYQFNLSFVPASDPPSLITQTTNYPSNTVGFVTTVFSSGMYRGTAFLVTPYTALTNGHNVIKTSTNEWVESFSFAPGQYQLEPGGTIYRPYGTKEASSVATNDDYIRTGSFSYDYAAVHFDEAFSGITTFMPLEFNTLPSVINILGYPATADGSWNEGQWHSSGNVYDYSASVLYYRAFSYGGSSGSPVYTYSSETGLRRVIAIHALGSNLYNGGPRLITANQSIIEDWMMWSPTGSSAINGAVVAEGKTSDNNQSISVELTDGTSTYNTTTTNDGTFSFTNINNSSDYTLTISFEGYLTRTVDSISVNNQFIKIADTENPIDLYAGDVDGLTGVDTGDLAYLISKLGLVSSDVGYDGIVDFDKVTGIDTGDLALIIKNLGKTSNDYQTWTW